MSGPRVNQGHHGATIDHAMEIHQIFVKINLFHLIHLGVRLLQRIDPHRDPILLRVTFVVLPCHIGNLMLLWTIASQVKPTVNEALVILGLFAGVLN